MYVRGRAVTLLVLLVLVLCWRAVVGAVRVAASGGSLGVLGTARTRAGVKRRLGWG